MSPPGRGVTGEWNGVVTNRKSSIGCRQRNRLRPHACRRGLEIVDGGWGNTFVLAANNRFCTASFHRPVRKADVMVLVRGECRRTENLSVGEGNVALVVAALAPAAFSPTVTLPSIMRVRWTPRNGICWIGDPGRSNG